MQLTIRSLSTLVLALALLAGPTLALAADDWKAPSSHKPGPGESGFLLTVHTANEDVTDGTDAMITTTLTFFKPAFHQFFWLLNFHGVQDKERNDWDSYFFRAPDNWEPVPGDVPYLGLKNDGCCGPDPGWLWDVLCVDQYNRGSVVTTWVWHNPSKVWVFGKHPWYNFGQGKQEIAGRCR
jgi:hypothetical protein